MRCTARALVVWSLVGSLGCGARDPEPVASVALKSSPSARASEAVPDQPRRAGTRQDVADVTVDRGSGCAVLLDGRVACWGRGPSGLAAEPRLVDGVEHARSAVLVEGELHVLDASGAFSVVRAGAAPVTVERGVAAMRAGATSFCTVDADAGVACTRRDGGTSGILSGRVSLGGPVADLRVGDAHLCGALTNGAVVCVGANDHAQLGAISGAGAGEVFAVPNIEDATIVSAGARHSCALRRTGDVVCWGDSPRAIGLGEQLEGAPRGPQPVPGVSGAVAIASGERTTCALDARGAAWCWGDNAHGQLGTEAVGERHSGPAPVVGVDFIRSIAPGDETCAVSASQRLYCWGNVVRFAPVKVFGVERASDIAAGGDRSCAVLGGDRVFCWGGAVVDASPTLTPAPVDVRGVRVAVSGGRFDGCAVTAGGHVDCWRRAIHTEPGVEDAVAVTNGLFHACALRRSGAVACWGANPIGELGRPKDDGDESVARDVPDLRDALAISSAGQSTCVIRGRGRVECWGSQSATKGVPAAGPVVVPDLEDAVQVAVGELQTCARRRSGRVVCWGYGGYRIDDGAPGPRPDGAHPVEMPIEDAIDVAVGTRFACAVRATGRIACWGELTDATRGGLPEGPPGTLIYEVQDLANAVRVAVGMRHACAMTAGGSVYCWGNNTAGQIGDRSGPGSPTEREIRLP